MRTLRVAFGFALAAVLSAGTPDDARTRAQTRTLLSAAPLSLAGNVDQPDGIVQAPALNHVYIVLDAATFAAFRKYLEPSRLLGRSDGGLPDYAPPAPSADRIFFRGRHTYLEIFAPDNRFGEPVGKVGLALGYDQTARFEALEQAWRSVCGNTARRTPVDFKRTEPSVPWYEALQCDGTAAGSHLAVWAMIYRPEFHRWQSGTGRDAPPRVARADVLGARAAEGQGRFDITALEINVEASLHAKLIKQLEGAGFKREDGPTGVRLRGDGWDLLLREVRNEPGLVSMSFATNMELPNDLLLASARLTQRSKGNLSLQFGKLTND